MSTEKVVFWPSSGDLYINNLHVGILRQLLGCCGVWHFFNLGLGSKTYPETVAEWLEDSLENMLSSFPPKHRGMLLLSASEEDGWGALMKALRGRLRWEEKKFFNPQTGHEVSLFTLVREGK